MDTISNIKEKINTLLTNPQVGLVSRIGLVMVLMGTSFLFGRLSSMNQVNAVEPNLAVYLPNGELYTENKNPTAQSPLSAYILGGAEKAVIPANGPTVSERVKSAQIPEIDKNTNNSDSESSIFGSKNGHTYYLVGCSGGKRVKVENRVYFTDENDALDHGYTKSKTCK